MEPADVSQRAVISVLYELPFAKGAGALHRIAGGWQLNTIGVMQTGIPLLIRGASNNLADRPDSSGKSAKLDNPNRDRWFDTTQFINPASPAKRITVFFRNWVRVSQRTPNLGVGCAK